MRVWERQISKSIFFSGHPTAPEHGPRPNPAVLSKFWRAKTTKWNLTYTTQVQIIPTNLWYFTPYGFLSIFSHPWKLPIILKINYKMFFFRWLFIFLRSLSFLSSKNRLLTSAQSLRFWHKSFMLACPAVPKNFDIFSCRWILLRLGGFHGASSCSAC